MGLPRVGAGARDMTDHARRWSVPPCSWGLRVGKEADIEIFGGVDQLFDGTAVALRVSAEELRDALLMRKLEQRVREIAALQAVHLHADFTRQRPVLIQTRAIRARPVWLSH